MLVDFYMDTLSIVRSFSSSMVIKPISQDILLIGNNIYIKKTNNIIYPYYVYYLENKNIGIECPPTYYETPIINNENDNENGHYYSLLRAVSAALRYYIEQQVFIEETFHNDYTSGRVIVG